MIAVIVDVEPADGRKEEYFDISARMRPMLGSIQGFIPVERFQSLTDPRKILSLSFFGDKTAISRPRHACPVWHHIPHAIAVIRAMRCGPAQISQGILNDLRCSSLFISIIVEIWK
ncbi:antibiotic biosynthesis monooxygenase family protein [Paracoccus sp. (in: a-proteobacteria)]|uniref:antibiotic biosynthesis monooxygenase family protein n=1 Tax=Paracoccus sp. TaxID=267 RepID=UPI003A8C5186